MPNKIFQKPNDDYLERTNVAIDYIVANLDRKLTLDEVAKVASFSPFHFHRIFQTQIGETIGQFVKRQRLERAVYLMSHAPNRSLTDIALECGFSSSSDFSRSFKTAYGTSPSKFDLEAFRVDGRKKLEELMASYDQGSEIPRLQPGDNPDDFQAQIVKLPPRTVAYIRVLDPYQPDAVTEASKRLVSWAEKNNCLEGPWLGYMWEDPEIVALEDCRYDVAVVLENYDQQINFRPQGEIGRYDFPEMQVAQVKIKGDIQLEQRAFDWIYGTWLPESRFEPAHQPAFEAWEGLPFAHGYEHFELYCQLPVTKR